DVLRERTGDRGYRSAERAAGAIGEAAGGGRTARELLSDGPAGERAGDRGEAARERLLGGLDEGAGDRGDRTGDVISDRLRERARLRRGASHRLADEFRERAGDGRHAAREVQPDVPDRSAGRGQAAGNRERVRVRNLARRPDEMGGA